MFEIDENEYESLTYYIKKKYGMNLCNKRKLIQSRIQHELDRLHIATFAEYMKIMQDNTEIEQRLLNLTATGYTYFMRESRQFQCLEQKILNNLCCNDVIRIWCAGCSTGEECYTTAMCVEECREHGIKIPKVEITGTDISRASLTIGEEGRYLPRQLVKAPLAWRTKYFKKDEEGYQVIGPIHDMVKFQYHNLADVFQTKHKYDVIFCRNVIVYMDGELRKKVVRELYESLKPGGYLILGNGEICHSGAKAWNLMGNSIYQKKE